MSRKRHWLPDANGVTKCGLKAILDRSRWAGGWWPRIVYNREEATCAACKGEAK